MEKAIDLIILEMAAGAKGVPAPLIFGSIIGIMAAFLLLSAFFRH